MKSSKFLKKKPIKPGTGSGLLYLEQLSQLAQGSDTSKFWPHTSRAENMYWNRDIWKRPQRNNRLK